MHRVSKTSAERLRLSVSELTLSCAIANGSTHSAPVEHPLPSLRTLSRTFRTPVLRVASWPTGAATGLQGRAADLGDVAGEVLEDRSLDHLIDLMEGRVQPSSEREQIIAERLQAIAEQHLVGRVA